MVTDPSLYNSSATGFSFKHSRHFAVIQNDFLDRPLSRYTLKRRQRKETEVLQDMEEGERNIYFLFNVRRSTSSASHY